MFNAEVYKLTARGCNATGVSLPNGEFVVLEGSTITSSMPTIRFRKRHPGSATMRQKLLIHPSGDKHSYYLAQTTIFRNAAHAASVLTGDIRDARSWHRVNP